MLSAPARTGVTHPILETGWAACCQATHHFPLKPTLLVLDWATDKTCHLRREMKKMRAMQSSLSETQPGIFISPRWQCSSAEPMRSRTMPDVTGLLHWLAQQALPRTAVDVGTLPHAHFTASSFLMGPGNLWEMNFNCFFCECWKLTFTSLEGPGKAHVKDLQVRGTEIAAVKWTLDTVYKLNDQLGDFRTTWVEFMCLLDEMMVLGQWEYLWHTVQ